MDSLNDCFSSVICEGCYDMQLWRRKEHSCSECLSSGSNNIYYGTDCVQKFCDDLYRKYASHAREKKAKIFVIAHNQKGYDGHFIIRDFYQRKFVAVPNIIMNGSKILYMSVENISFIDSLSLFMQPLSALCKSFNITELKKGFFPHKFNTPQNQQYIGPYPEQHYYDPENMKPALKQEFSTWYSDTTTSAPIFDFKEELISYCVSDVEILTTAMMKFIDHFTTVTSLNPITRRFTLELLPQTKPYKGKKLLAQATSKNSELPASDENSDSNSDEVEATEEQASLKLRKRSSLKKPKRLDDYCLFLKKTSLKADLLTISQESLTKAKLSSSFYSSILVKRVSDSSQSNHVLPS